MIMFALSGWHTKGFWNSDFKTRKDLGMDVTLTVGIFGWKFVRIEVYS